MKKIRVSASSANLGPGFDVFGLALTSSSSSSASQKFSNSLEIHFEQLTGANPAASGCRIQCEGVGAESLSDAVEENLVTKVALYVLCCHGKGDTGLSNYQIRISCGIALSRGLGSSAAAVVAGAMLANEVGHLNLSKDEMFDYCLMIERHPDNIGAALFGGFVGTSMRPLSPPTEPCEVLFESSRKLDKPPRGIGSYQSLDFHSEIKIILVIPDYHLNTAEARARLPENYSRADIVFNTQRCAILPALLKETPLQPAKIWDAMQDRLHQPHRASLMPGFSKVLQELTPDAYPGLLGVCLSGAGPSILALATNNLETIAQAIVTRLSEAQDVHYDWQVLEVDRRGATCDNS